MSIATDSIIDAEFAEVLSEARDATAQGAHYVARELVASVLDVLHVIELDFAVFRDGTLQLHLDGVPFVLSNTQRAALARGINRGEAQQ
jgi:hypothetical protein